jgi:hypothetical protein
MNDRAMPGGAAAPTAPAIASRSWVSLLIEALERLPGPAWLAYVIGSVAGIVVQLAEGGIDQAAGWPVSPQVLLSVVYYGALPFAVLALISRLDTAAAEALGLLRPLLGWSEAGAARALDEMTRIPAGPTWVVTALAFVSTGLGFALDPVGSGIVGYSPIGLGLRFLWETIITTLFLVLIYHTIRQLRAMGRLHESIEAIDLFDQAPLFSVSSVSSTTAIGLVVLLVPSVFLIPSDAGAAFLLMQATWYLFALSIAAGSFFLPLRGVHARLATEKARLQGEVGRRMSAAIGELNAAIDAGDRDRVGSSQQSLSALTSQRDLIAKLPTWPWSGAALTRFLSAVLLPIGLWLVTRVLERIV